jgi:hypothetical protein
MESNRQRILVIILFIGAVFMFSFFLYWFFWRPLFGTEQITTPTATTTPGQLTGAGTAGIRPTSTTTAGQLSGAGTTISKIFDLPQVNSEPVIDSNKAELLANVPAYYVSMSADGDMFYYNPNDGKFYKINSLGQPVLLSNEYFPGVKNATFDSKGAKAILEYPDGSKIVYDFTASKQYTLPKHWNDIKFSPTDQQLVFKSIGLDPENRSLVITNYDGSEAKIIESIGLNADKVQTNWSPNNQVVANYVEGKDASRSEIFFVGQNNENFKSLIVQGRDFRGVWSPTGDQILYSTYDTANGYKPQLWISNATGDETGANRVKIELQTWSDKCTFAGTDYAFCAVPQSMPYGAGLEPGLADAIADDIYAIDLKTGQTRLIAQPTNSQYVNKIMFDPANPSQIYYSGKYDNKIYRLNF